MTVSIGDKVVEVSVSYSSIGKGTIHKKETEWTVKNITEKSYVLAIGENNRKNLPLNELYVITDYSKCRSIDMLSGKTYTTPDRVEKVVQAMVGTLMKRAEELLAVVEEQYNKLHKVAEGAGK